LLARIEEGLLTQLALAKSCNVYIDPERLESQAPRSIAQVRILSPFDNLVIQRQRCREVFAYDFQIECYVPEPLRQFGYFCLPLQYRDRLVGRIDCKAHRAQARLEVKSVHIEKPVGKDFQEQMSTALKSFASFNGCEQIDIADARHADISGLLQTSARA
jgi:hypothetical protein